MKKEIKINFKNFWEGFNPKNNLIINILKKNYQPVLSDNPDFVFYSVYEEPKIGKKKNLYKKGDFIRRMSPLVYVFLRKTYSTIFNKQKGKISPPKGDFIKIFFSLENNFPIMAECDWAFGSLPLEIVNHPNYFRVPAYKIGETNLIKKRELPLRRKINFKKIKKDKIKFCNFIYSQENMQRNNFFKLLNKYKSVDSPGRCMNNMGPIKGKSSRESRLSVDWEQDKLDFLKQYKFTISFENINSPGWITEKLTHPLLVNSIPIYFGTKTVDKEFNTKAFINYNDFQNINELISHILKVDRDDKLWEEYLKEPIFKSKKQYEFATGKIFAKKLIEIINIELKKIK